MQNIRTEIGDVIYNPVEQSFEAKVTVHEGSRITSYPCAINAPITMSFPRAARGLVKQALRRHGKPSALRSILQSAQRAGLRIASVSAKRRGLPEGEFGYFRGRAA